MDDYEIGMYASEARERGLSVPDDVPDCATLETTGYDLSGPEEATSEQANRRELPALSFTVSCSWRWLSISGTVPA